MPSKSSVTTTRERIPGGELVTIHENGRAVIAYTTFAGYNLAQALTIYRRAKRLYGANHSLPFQGHIQV